MAKKMIFISSNKSYYREEILTYTFYSGFAVSQKQKSIASLHESIKRIYPEKRVIEISTKSTEEIGIKLSAFNLKFFHEELQDYRNLENIFQSSKVFENGGPYRDLLNVPPKDAKRDERFLTSGTLKYFDLYGVKWSLEPKTMFYDWIYINALNREECLAEKITDYDIFTDVEFNHKKSINCQARSAAIFVTLKRKGELEKMLSDPVTFSQIYAAKESEQMSFLWNGS